MKEDFGMNSRHASDEELRTPDDDEPVMMILDDPPQTREEMEKMMNMMREHMGDFPEAAIQKYREISEEHPHLSEKQVRAIYQSWLRSGGVRAIRAQEEAANRSSENTG